MLDKLDAIIVGSGFGGAFAADALVAAGLRVAMVERGPWRDNQAMRNAGIPDRSPYPRHGRFFSHYLRTVSAGILPRRGLTLNRRGFVELHVQHNLTVVCTSNVGGGSHIYTAMNVPPAVAHFWDGHAEGLDDTGMQKHIHTCLQRLGARPERLEDNVPNFVGRLFADDPDFAPYPEQPPMSYRYATATHRANSFFGCSNGNKVTLDELLIEPASRRGLTVLDLHEAVDLDRDGSGWRLTVRDLRRGETRTLTAPRLLLAAGALNTLRLLLAARERGHLGALPALGQGFGSNGDTISYWAMNREGVDFTEGATCHGRFMLRDQPDGPNLTVYGFSGLEDIPLLPGMHSRARRDLLLVGMGADQANGIVRYPKSRLKIEYDAADSPIYRRIQDSFEEITRRSGHKIYQLKSWPITVHPVGGARAGNDARHAVVDGHGEVHGLPGLYVADAAGLPGAPGAPPSLSIAAWGCHVAEGIARKG
ncbi:MAG: GMC family oxidoreductase [Nevskiaceae bacterium]|nr:MAG: GMC family oxidoreductase [Nevskiaceae bacterium]TBR73955.1 MAG: GMC family oxidoreductase [Nevskiaceae bacterium]